MKRFLIVLIVLFVGAASLAFIPIYRTELVYLVLGVDMHDHAGELATGSVSRASATTRVDPDTGYVEQLWGNRSQLIDTTTGQNPTDTDSWWTKSRCSFDSSGGFIATVDNDSHQIYKTGQLSANTIYVFSAKVKVGAYSVGHVVSLNLRHDGGVGNYATFNLDTGLFESIGGYDSYGFSGPDSEGYYRIWITETVTTVSGTNLIGFQVNETTADSTWSGDGVTPSNYIKEMMLETLPSANALSAELMPNQVDRDFSGASAWANGDQ